MKEMKAFVCKIAAAAMLVLAVGSASAQLTPGEVSQQVQLNTITTAVPFLMIAPDSRSGALGDAGVALSQRPACSSSAAASTLEPLTHLFC